MRPYLVWVIAIAVVWRCLWFTLFVGLSVLRRGRKGRLHALRDDMRLPARLQGSKNLQAKRREHFDAQVTAAYTVGGLALAAWSVLAAASSPDHLALGFLAVTVIASIGCPVLFRWRGGEWTRMGYESGLAIAGMALVLAMLTLGSAVLHGPWVTGAVWLIPAIMLVRDLAETRVQMRLTRKQVFPAQISHASDLP